MSKKVEKQDFNVLGKVFTVSEERARYNMYRSMFSKLADKLSDKYMKEFLETATSIDYIHAKGFEQGLLCIFGAITETVNILVEHKIYDIDEEVFFNEYFSKYCTWEQEFNRVDDRYMEIVCSAEELREYREARKESRGKFVGGGFGIDGAIGGAIQAGALNLATGAAHSFLNYLENKATEKRVRQEKEALFEDPSINRILVEGIWENAFNVQFALYDIIGHLEGENWDIVGNRDEEKVNTLLSNLIRVKGVENKSELLLQCLELDPYNTKIYDAILADASLDSGEIGRLCEFFCLDIKKILGPSFEEMLNKCEKTEEGVNACIEKIREKMKQYSMTDNFFVEEAYKKLESVLSKKYKQDTSKISDLTKLHSYQEEMLQKIQTYQKEHSKFAEKLKKTIEKDLRTYDGVEYKTREERAQVEQNDVEIKEKFKDIKNLSEEQVNELCYELEKGKFSGSCKKHCKKEAEKYFDSLLKNEHIDIDKLSKEELLALKARIQEGRYSKKCKKEFFEKIDTINTKRLIEQPVKEQGLSTVNEILNYYFGKDTWNDDERNMVVKLLNRQIEIAAQLYSAQISEIYVVKDYCVFNSKKIDDKIRSIRIFYAGKKLQFEENEVVLIIRQEQDPIRPNYVITNKRIVLNKESGNYVTYELDDCLEIRASAKQGFKNIYDSTKEYVDSFYFPYGLPSEQKDIVDDEDIFVAGRFTKFFEKIRTVNSEVAQMEKVLSKLVTDSAVLKSFSREKLEKEYDEWKKHKQYGVQVTNYLNLIEEAIKETYKKEASALCAGLSDMSVGELTELKKKLEKEFSNAQFSDFVKEEKLAVSAELQRKKDAAAREEIAEKTTKLTSFTRGELEKEYDEWVAYNGKVTEVKDFLQAIEGALRTCYKKEAGEMCADLEILSVAELNSLLERFDKVFSDTRFSEFVAEERDKVTIELDKKKDMAVRAEIAEDTAKLSSLGVEELEDMLGKWDAYKGKLPEVKEFTNTILNAIKVACKAEAREMCANAEDLSANEIKELIVKLKKTFKRNGVIEEEIAFVENVLIKKQEQEIKEWMPENPDALSEQELNSLITKYDAQQYDSSLYSVYALPLIEKRNMRIAEQGEKLATFINSKAFNVDKCVFCESKTDMLKMLSQQTEVYADTLVCKIGIVPECCFIYTKKFVIGQKEFLWNSIAYFEFKKKFFGSTLKYQCKDGTSGEIKLMVPTDYLSPIADLLNDIHSYIIRNIESDPVGVAPSQQSVSPLQQGGMPGAMIGGTMAGMLQNTSVSENNVGSQTAPAQNPQQTVPVAAGNTVPLTTAQRSFSEIAEFVNRFPSISSEKVIGTWNPKFAKKRQNAVKAYATGVREDEIFALYDDTLFGSGKEGFVMTLSGMVIKTSFRNTFRCSYSDIKGIKIIYDESAKLTKIFVDTQYGMGEISGSCGDSGCQMIADRINEIVKFLYGLEQNPYVVEKSSQASVTM